MTKYYVDSEFIDDGSTIDLISIGMVCEDGREFYAQNEVCDLMKASRWVEENVVPYLDTFSWRNQSQIRDDLYFFLNPTLYGKPELYGWCAAYDYVALCQLYGTMMDLPDGWPHYIKELQSLLDEKGWSDDMLPKQEGQAHNALEDARYIQDLWKFVESYPL